MAIGIHFDDDEIYKYEDTLGIGIGHREESTEASDDMTMGIGIGHRAEDTDANKEKEW